MTSNFRRSACAGVAALTLPALSWAETTTWNDSSNSWNSGLWTAGVPEAGDEAVLATPGVTVFYLSATDPVLGRLTINAVGGTQLLQARDSLTALEQVVGDTASGTFTQTGGINTVAGTTTQRLTLGNSTGGVGTYEISNGTLRANRVTVGGGVSGTSFGTGTFRQTGGTVDLLAVGSIGELLVGDATGSTGSYELTAGSLLTRSTFIGVSPDGSGSRTFVQTGGSHQVTGSLNLGGFVGGGTATTGSYSLGGLATASLTAAHANIGVSGSGTFVHTNGTHQIAGTLSLGGYDGGSVSAAGSYTLSGTSSSALTVGDEFVGVSGTGTFTQEGGVHTISGGLVVAAYTAGSVGTFHLKSGSLTAAAEFIGNPGQGSFLHTGGTNTVNGQLWIDSGGTAASSGSYTISGGSLTTNGSGTDPGLLNAGTFQLQSGGLVTVNGAGSNAGLDNTGTFTLSGGTLAGNAPKINHGTFTGHGLVTGAGALINRGTMTFTGGTTTVDSDVFNDAGFTLEVDSIVAVFNGDVSNDGTFKTTAATTVFNGSVSIGGTFLSDPSVQTYYGDVTVTSGGALVSPPPGGDIWQIGYDLIVESVNRSGWDTLLGKLEFFTPTGLTLADHEFRYSATDLGATYDGYLENFAWGIVEVAADSRLVNTNDAALYTEQLLLGGGAAQIATFTGDLAIYYDPAEPANGYLGGATYSFGSGTGFVAPVPEPSALAMLALGAIALGARRRR